MKFLLCVFFIVSITYRLTVFGPCWEVRYLDGIVFKSRLISEKAIVFKFDTPYTDEYIEGNTLHLSPVRIR